MITLSLHATYVDRRKNRQLIYHIHGDESSLIALRARAATFGRFHSLGEKQALIDDNTLYISAEAAEYYKYSHVMTLPVSAFWARRRYPNGRTPEEVAHHLLYGVYTPLTRN